MPLTPAKKSKRVAKTRKSKTSWKKEAAQRKKISSIKKVVFRYTAISLLFVFSFITLFGYISYKNLTKSFVSALNGNNTAQTDPIRNKDVVVVLLVGVNDLTNEAPKIEQAEIAIMSKNDSVISVYSFDTQSLLDFPGKYSREPIDKNLGLALSLNNGDLNKSIDLTVKTFENHLALSIDRYIFVNRDVFTYFDIFIKEGSLSTVDFGFLYNLKDLLKTNMTVDDMISYYQNAKTFGQPEILNLTDETSTTTSDLDIFIQQKAIESSVAQERKTISILNGTQIPGLAGYAGRVVKNMGGRVISIQNDSMKRENTFLISNDFSSHTVLSIKGFFDKAQLVTKDQAQSEISQFPENDIDRADVILILGLDTAETL